MYIRFLIVMLAFSINANAKTDTSKTQSVHLGFSYSTVGANIYSAFETQKKKISFFGGLTYHVNSPINDLRSYKYYHRFNHKKAINAWGLNIGFTRKINIKHSDINLRFVFQNQLNRMHNRILVIYCDTNRVYYLPPQYIYLETPSTMWISETTLGIRMDIKAYKNIFLNAAVLCGVSNYFVKNQYTNYSLFHDWDIFTFNFKLGLSYQFRSKIK